MFHAVSECYEKGGWAWQKNNCRHSAKASSDSVMDSVGCRVMRAIDAPER